MKKNFSLAIVFAIAFSFLGVNVLQSSFQTVPVTVAQLSPIQSAAAVEPEVPVVSAKVAVTAVAQAPTTLPTIAPIITNTPLIEEPAATVVAAEVISRAPTQTAEEILFNQFVQSVTGKEADLVTGVYVPGRFSLPVLQQPAGDASFVSTQDNSVTQFRSARVYGTIGLLAHNYLSGKKYFDLREGDDVVIVYGNGDQSRYRINRIERFQALSPTSVYSDFINLSDPTQAKLSASQVFNQIYTTENQVVFQTCIEANGDPSWGRIFVIADKINP